MVPKPKEGPLSIRECACGPSEEPPVAGKGASAEAAPPTVSGPVSVAHRPERAEGVTVVEVRDAELKAKEGAVVLPDTIDLDMRTCSGFSMGTVSSKDCDVRPAGKPWNPLGDFGNEKRGEARLVEVDVDPMPEATSGETKGTVGVEDPPGIASRLEEPNENAGCERLVDSEYLPGSSWLL